MMWSETFSIKTNSYNINNKWNLKLIKKKTFSRLPQSKAKEKNKIKNSFFKAQIKVFSKITFSKQNKRINKDVKASKNVFSWISTLVTFDTSLLLDQ